MEYKCLKDLYYASEEEYAKAYISRFESEDAVKVDFMIEKNKPFSFKIRR